MALNIVCLHGFTQNIDILKKKLSNLTKSIKNINLFYLDGAAILSEADNSRAYWYYDKETPINAVWSDHYKTDTKLFYLEESLNDFIKLGQQIGHIDGIIGFSQGGCFADYICKMCAAGRLPFSVRFAVFIAAEYFNRPGYEFDGVEPAIQTLHIYGLGDTVILPELSEALTKYYPNKEVLVHSGAHVIPSNAAAKAALRQLIAKVN